MIYLKFFMVLTVSFFFSDFSFAQCPYGIPNTPGCVPPDAWSQNNGTQSAPQMQQRWVYTWGAMAKDSYALGVSTGLNSKRQAEKVAVKDCQAKGGGKECKAFLSYYHQCAAFAMGETLGYASGPNIDEVKSRAIANCEKVGGQGQCRIYYSDCTEPYLR